MQLNSSPDETLIQRSARARKISTLSFISWEDYTKNTLANAIHFIVICMWKLPTIKSSESCSLLSANQALYIFLCIPTKHILTENPKYSVLTRSYKVY